MLSIPPEFLDLLSNEVRAYAYLATLMPDGSPQVTPVWFDTDGEYILVNSAAGRVKDKNMRARPQVAITIADPRTPYRYLQIRGRVVAITEEGAEEHIDRLAGKYTGVPKRSWDHAGEVRVTYQILPEKVDAHG